MNIEEINRDFVRSFHEARFSYEPNRFLYLQNGVFKDMDFSKVEELKTTIEPHRADIMWYWMKENKEIVNLKTKNGIEYRVYMEELPIAGEPYMQIYSYKDHEFPEETDWIIQSAYDFEHTLFDMFTKGVLEYADIPDYLTDNDIDYAHVEYVDILTFKHEVCLTEEQQNYLKEHDDGLLKQIQELEDSDEVNITCAISTIQTFMEKLEKHFPYNVM